MREDEGKQGQARTREARVRGARGTWARAARGVRAARGARERASEGSKDKHEQGRAIARLSDSKGEGGQVR